MTEAPDPPEETPVSQMSFEEALAELESVVARLEGGQVPLEESIRLYERGDALRKRCEEKLREAELKVEKIVAGPDGATGTEPFESG
jgi:exodeoxyribonuclease VII small subunit